MSGARGRMEADAPPGRGGAWRVEGAWDAFVF
jgi:hypothetical protein